MKAARDFIVKLPQSKAALQQILGTVQMINTQFCRTVDGEQYTFYYVYTVGQPESSEALDALGNIHKLYADTFAGQKLLSAGSTQTVMDMEKVTGTDFTVIALLSAAIILVIIAIVFRSVWKAIIVTLVIELGIFINLSLNVVFGMTINFVTYIIISAIQLGATVDYAILLTNKYREARLTERDNTKAVGKAMSQSVFSIIISVAILVSACMSVFLFSGDPIIREITMMIARGSFISGLLVVFLLPAIYMLLYGKSKKTDDDGGETERQNLDAADTEMQ